MRDVLGYPEDIAVIPPHQLTECLQIAFLGRLDERQFAGDTFLCLLLDGFHAAPTQNLIYYVLRPKWGVRRNKFKDLYKTWPVTFCYIKPSYRYEQKPTCFIPSNFRDPGPRLPEPAEISRRRAHSSCDEEIHD